MKRIILALIAAMTLCSLVQAKNRTVTENDSLGNKKRVIELRDTTIDGKTVTDTHRLHKPSDIESTEAKSLQKRQLGREYWDPH